MRRRDLLEGLALTGLAGLAFPARAQDGAPVVGEIRLLNGRVVMPVSIAGNGPYLFLLDTGGTNSLIDEALARELRLKSLGGLRAAGIGGTTSLSFYTARNVIFGGGVRQPEVTLAGMPNGFGKPIRGALDAGILTSVDSDLDIATGEWRIYPAGRPERVGFVRFDNAIRSANRTAKGASSPRLFGPAQLNGVALDCLLDTGAPGAISLAHDTARRLGLWDDARPFAPQGTFGIAGSGGVGRIVRADTAMFAGQRFDRPLVLLRGPGNNSRTHDGIVGLSMLRGFNLSTQPSTRALWLQRHADAAPPAESYNLAGLWVEDKDGEVRVASVGTGSPAFAAGIRTNDRIVGMDLRAAIAAISGGPGKQVELSIGGAGGARKVRFTMAPYL